MFCVNKARRTHLYETKWSEFPFVSLTHRLIKWHAQCSSLVCSNGKGFWIAQRNMRRSLSYLVWLNLAERIWSDIVYCILHVLLKYVLCLLCGEKCPGPIQCGLGWLYLSLNVLNSWTILYNVRGRVSLIYLVLEGIHCSAIGKQSADNFGTEKCILLTWGTEIGWGDEYARTNNSEGDVVYLNYS